MCGIVGFLPIADLSSEALSNVTGAMADSLSHRGPDSSGEWVSTDPCVALGHRRLSVLELSHAGDQPMRSVCGRYVVCFNGEIYNHLNLRDQLAANTSQSGSWRGHSDTETLLACFEAWGVEESLKRLVGMFAIAVWDWQEKRLLLARDRLGEKPLYYGWCEGGFFFGSELKALRQFPGFSNAISRDALTLYFRYSYVPAPYSIYEDIYKLEPGCMMTISLSATSTCPESVPHAPGSGDGWAIKKYWDLHDKVTTGQASAIHDEKVGLSALESTLKESIQLQSIADVPLGAFLSGGVDSSLIVALMQSLASQPVKTFTIGFDEDGYNEANYAKAVAKHLRTEHTELYVSATQAMDVIPQLPELYDEPFADSSQIPTFLVAQMARDHVTVALSGDAGDELFGGYNRYFWGPKIWEKASLLPSGLRRKLGALLISSSGSAEASQSVIKLFLPDKLRNALLGEKLQKLGRRLENVENIDEFYHSLVSEWSAPEEIVLDGKEPLNILNARFECSELHEAEDRMMYKDAMTYLPDDILCKVDRAAMAVSLETRVPFLDHRVAELAWRLPLEMKIRNGQGKWALRQILNKYVPKELIERPKQGFGIPLGQWLRGPLREWAENLLDSDRLTREGYLRSEPIRQKWVEHLSGKRNWEHSLWSVLMFQSWLEKQQETI
ncbi:MAG: asparagine synthase (glutamine-hydrolyzing) [Gammaproteobacteria bacterium]|nr:asparagine synthase (glutamine-hydrolyzing) [Gammaproteobacteria bacterium]